MDIIKRTWIKALRIHEHSCGAASLFCSPNTFRGKNIRAGYGLRLSAVMGGKIEIGDDVTFDRWVDLFAREGQLTIGKDCHFGKGCVISAHERIVIGSNCQIAEHVTIRDQDHRIQPHSKIKDNGYITVPVVLGENVWVGANVVITKGVSIGDEAVIGAGAVVTRDIPARAKALGVPARFS